MQASCKKCHPFYFRKSEDDSDDKEDPPPMGWGRLDSPVPSIGSESPIWDRSESPISVTSRTSLIGSPVLGNSSQ